MNTHEAIRVGYLSDYIPFCGMDENGAVSGVITDILSRWQEELGLSHALGV